MSEVSRILCRVSCAQPSQSPALPRRSLDPEVPKQPLHKFHNHISDLTVEFLQLSSVFTVTVTREYASNSTTFIVTTCCCTYVSCCRFGALSIPQSVYTHRYTRARACGARILPNRAGTPFHEPLGRHRLFASPRRDHALYLEVLAHARERTRGRVRCKKHEGNIPDGERGQRVYVGSGMRAVSEWRRARCVA